MKKSLEQRIFDRVARHLLKQGEKSVRGDYGQCAYRGDDGLRCAVGCLIPNRLYDENIEGWSPESERVSNVLAEALRVESGEVPVFFLGALQVIHDKSDPSEWPVALREFAASHSLDEPKELQL